MQKSWKTLKTEKSKLEKVGYGNTVNMSEHWQSGKIHLTISRPKEPKFL